MRAIEKSNTSNSDQIRKSSSLIGSANFKKSLILFSKNPNDSRSIQLNKRTLKLLSFAG